MSLLSIGITPVSTQMQRLFDKYGKLLENIKERAIAIVDELMQRKEEEACNIINVLLRNIVAADFSPRNIWLMNTVTNMSVKHRFDEKIYFFTFT